MRPQPENTLDPRVKTTWRIADAIAVVVLAAFVLVPLGIIVAATDNTAMRVLLIVSLALTAVALAVVIFALPNYRYARWRWRVTSEFVEIKKGIIWQRWTIIPFIRVQNTDTRQGPLMRAIGLADVTLATAAGEHVIPGLDLAAAEELRDRAAELARIAREDV